MKFRFLVTLMGWLLAEPQRRILSFAPPATDVLIELTQFLLVIPICEFVYDFVIVLLTAQVQASGRHRFSKCL